MKKLFSLVLAVAMVMSMAAVVLAVEEEEQIWGILDAVYFTESDGVLKNVFVGSDPIPYGKTAFFALFCEDNGKGYGDDVTFTFGESPNEKSVGPFGASELVVEYDVVKGVKPKLSYEMGSSYVDSVEIVKKKQNFLQDESGRDLYAYFVAVKIKSSTSTSKVDVIGEIQMKKSKQVRDVSDLVDGADFAFSVGYNPAESLEELKKDPFVYDFKDSEDEEWQIDLYGEAGYFIVNTVGQGKLVLFNDTKFNADVAALYPDANLDFVIGSGTSFNKTGELYLFADEGSYLYQLKADGTLAAVKAEYDEYEEAFVVKTRTLGSYVISDIELELAPVVVEPDETDEPAEPENPATGAVA
jgi:hypothetical protein